MPVPDFQSYMTPMLQLMSDKQERRITDISEILAHYFGLSIDDLNESIPSGKKSRHYDRVGWAATYLKQAELLSSTKRGWYQITPRGLEIARSQQPVNTEFLRQFKEFQDFQSRTRIASTNGEQVRTIVDTPSAVHTPDEILEEGYQALRNTLALDLLDRVKGITPEAFEQLVIDLLLAMGYGGSRREATRRVGRSGDGGIDGIINEDRLGLDVIYLQAKRWQGSIAARDVRDFAGSLEERKAVKGVFITTSEFTRDAREFVSRIGKRIVLIDGSELAQFMIDFGIGVVVREVYEIKKIDEEYFSEV
jgi:restriction system protein